MNWLTTNKKVAKQIYLSLADHENTNPLDNGEPDLVPYHRALVAARMTIIASQKELIEGPYDDSHFELLSTIAELDNFLPKQREKFWRWFHFNCAMAYIPGQGWPKERLYMEGLTETFRIYAEEDFEDAPEDSVSISDLTMQR